MCRNIRVLHNFQPPTTPEEIQAASLQFDGERVKAKLKWGARVARISKATP